MWGVSHVGERELESEHVRQHRASQRALSRTATQILGEPLDLVTKTPVAIRHHTPEPTHFKQKAISKRHSRVRQAMVERA